MTRNLFDDLDAYRKLQTAHCDHSRGTRKGARILRNIGEVARFFPLDEPVLCVGSGDGLEVEAWQLLGYHAHGVEVSPEKAMIARDHGAATTEAPAEGLDAVEGLWNIYCAHTLEHCRDARAVLAHFLRMALSTICIIVPVEPRGTRNPSHLSPVLDLGQIRIPGMHEVMRYERHNDEPEGIIVWRTY